MNIRHSSFFLSGFLAFVIFFSFLFVVREGQTAMILRLGNIVLDETKVHAQVYGPGLHFRIPFLTQVKLFDTRLQTLEPPPSRVGTSEMKDLIVDYYVKWQIKDVSMFYRRTSGRVEHAKMLLEQQISNALRVSFGKRQIKDLISDDRLNVMNELRHAASQSAAEIGVELMDVRIKRIDLPDEVSAAVYSRMRTDRQRVATEHRAQGQAAAESIRADADKNVILMLAEAKKSGEEIRAEGDIEAAKIYAQAYDKDAEFYAFYRSILAYRAVFSKPTDVLVLQPDTQFFKYFNSALVSSAAQQ